MSIASEPVIPVVAAAPGLSMALPAFDAGFEGRWSLWKARGIARERAFRRRLTLIAASAALVALAIFTMVALSPL